ncbi:MAG: hypothetical protein Q4C25_00175 [Bacillota bacterium]|nr:hypothetical protein [Bacillota bacterium]
MKIKIRTKGFRLSMPVPLRMAGMMVRMIPDKQFEQMREETPPPYDALMTKEVFVMLCQECLDVLREYKGLEMVHVEASDGTFVSIKL